MLCPSAAYLVTFKMVLLFVTSEAVIDMGKAKDTVRKLLNNFQGTYLDFESKALIDLKLDAGYLTRDGMYNDFLKEIAQNKSICETLLEKIDDFVENFRELLNEAGIQSNQDKYIPLRARLTQLRELCPSQPGKPTKRNKASTSGSEGADIRDESGFRIEQGKQEVKSLLDVFLQLAFDIKCNDMQSLANFANSLLDNTNLYTAVSTMAYKWAFQSTIMSHIDNYARDFRQSIIVPEVGDDDNDVELIPIELIPMREILIPIRRNCVRPGDTSPNPLVDQI